MMNCAEKNDMKIVIGKNMKKFRESQGITQTDLARYMQYGEKSIKSAISRIEKGELGMSLNKLKLAAEYLGIHVVDLLYPAEYTSDEIEMILNLHRMIKKSEKYQKSIHYNTIKLLLSQAAKE